MILKAIFFLVQQKQDLAYCFWIDGWLGERSLVNPWICEWRACNEWFLGFSDFYWLICRCAICAKLSRICVVPLCFAMALTFQAWDTTVLTLTSHSLAAHSFTLSLLHFYPPIFYSGEYLFFLLSCLQHAVDFFLVPKISPLLSFLHLLPLVLFHYIKLSHRQTLVTSKYFILKNLLSLTDEDMHLVLCISRNKCTISFYHVCSLCKPM